MLTALPVLKAFPTLYEERREAIEAEDRDARLDTPIFVCQLSFPGMPTLLHFFEPRYVWLLVLFGPSVYSQMFLMPPERYRLMLRRCLESSEQCFGMIMPPKPGGAQTEYGTMLEIRSVQMQPDGRSLVETWGSYRFRILERGTLDGYMVGRIERSEHSLPSSHPADDRLGPTGLRTRTSPKKVAQLTLRPPPLQLLRLLVS